MLDYYMDRREYEDKYGEEVGYCNVHKLTVVDRSCDQCDNEARCGECEEVRLDEDGEIDARVQAGMKCGVCAYG